MKLRPNKRKISDELNEKDGKHKESRRKSAPSTRPTVAVGPSPAKKPRTNRPRVAGSKLPHFLLGENGDDPKARLATAGDDGSQDDYDFNDVVNAVALTLAEASQNDSGTPTPAQNGDQVIEVSGEEVSGGNDVVESAGKKRKETEATSAPPPEEPLRGNRRPPSKRIKMLRKAEESRAEARNAEAADEPRPKTRVMPARSKKKKLFSGDENSGLDGLDALATLADLSLAGLELPEGARGDGKLEDFVSQALNSVKKEQEKGDDKSPTDKRKRKRGDKLLAEASTSGKQETIYKSNRPKRVPQKNFRRNEDFEHDMDRLERMEESASNHGDYENGKTKGKKRFANEKALQETKARIETRPCSHTTAELGPSSAQVRLQHYLSNPEARQWCIYEWLYSAIDLPWFAKNEFLDYLRHAGLDKVTKLSRCEWAVIRNALGKPRRFSTKFLQEERQKLESYRDVVRSYYQDIRTTSKDGSGLPTDLAPPLSVGQRVTARHPRTRGLHDGSVLTVDRNRCRVQFDRHDLGVEFVQDIDAMPVDPTENMSEEMRLKRRGIIDFSMGHRANSGAARAALNERLERSGPGNIYSYYNALCQAQADSVDPVSRAKAMTSEVAAAVQQGMPQSSAHAQEREADISCLAELARQLDKKEALLLELHRMNDESAKPVSQEEGFQRQLATVVLQLKTVNSKLAAALLHLRQRNKYQENLVAPWHSPSAGTMEGLYSGLSAGSPAEEITLSTRKDARSMVSAAVQAICCIQEGEDASSKQGLGKASSNGQPQPGESLGTNHLANNHHHRHHSDEQLNIINNMTNNINNANNASADNGNALQPAGTTNEVGQEMTTTTETKMSCGVEKTFPSQLEAFIPTEQIASCIATMLMLQTCTEKRMPPSDVAVMMENALANLRPRNAQNHAIYKDIEQCFDVLKNQVNAQVSIQPNLSIATTTTTAATVTTTQQPMECQLR